jgi:hypothetical protein
MNTAITRAALVALVFVFSPAANADFGVGFKAGTLGLGIEGRWAPLPWLDLRVGANQYDYADTVTESGIRYDGTLALDTYYVTGNFHFPLSPFRLTAGAFSNGNELQILSQDTGGTPLLIGGNSFDTAEIGALGGVASFGSTAPYVGFGYDFEIFGKVGLNLDIGVLWQGEPTVGLYATQYDTASPATQAMLDAAFLTEQAELEDAFSNFKAWPVLSLSFVYNF